MSLIKKYLEEKACKSKVAEAKEKDDSKDDGTGTDEIETSDYKIDKHGKKYRAHKIVFNKGEEDGKGLGEEKMSDDQMKKREDYVKGMKKNYSSFVDKYGKDRAKSVMYATATKMAMKEEVELVEEASASYHEKMAAQHSHHSQRHESEVTNGGHDDHDYASFAHDTAEKAHNAAAAAIKKHGAESDQYKKAAEHAKKETAKAKDESSHLKFKKVAKPEAIKEETELEESWNKGSSSSNHSDRTKALQYKAKAEQKLKAAKLVGKDHPSYNAHMSDYHSAMAKHVKHAYHAAQYGSQSDAKKAHDSHIDKAKEYKSGISEGVLDTVKKVAKKVVDTVGHKDDSELLKDLKKKAGVKEGWEDMLKASQARAAASKDKTKTTTATHHDVKKTSTGTVYTKQHDKDGISKGTGEPAPDQKRGRGRPKKDKFAEAVEFLMDLTEEQFDFVVEEGLDSFVESFLDESAKGYQPGWMIKASPELKAKIDAIKAKHAAMRKAMGNPAAGKSVGK